MVPTPATAPPRTARPQSIRCGVPRRGRAPRRRRSLRRTRDPHPCGVARAGLRALRSALRSPGGRRLPGRWRGRRTRSSHDANAAVPVRAREGELDLTWAYSFDQGTGIQTATRTAEAQAAPSGLRDSRRRGRADGPDLRRTVKNLRRIVISTQPGRAPAETMQVPGTW